MKIMKKTKELFLEWSNKKYEIDSSINKYKVHKRQFWLYNIWVNIWNEESKDNNFLRPCLILNNYFKWDLILIIPLTSKFNKSLEDVYYKIIWKKYWLNKDSYLLLNQFKVISKKRLIRKIDSDWKMILFDYKEFMFILNSIKSMI